MASAPATLPRFDRDQTEPRRTALPTEHLPFALLAATLLAVAMDAHTMFGWDEAEYATLGRSMLRGEGFAISREPNHYRLPVVPAAAAAAMTVFGTDDRAAKRCNLVFALLALTIVYVGARAAYGTATGLAAAVLLGAEPSFWIYTTRLLTELPFLAFFSGAVFSLHRALDGRPRFFLAAAAFAAAAFLTRYTAVLFAPLALLITAGFVIGGRVEPRRLRREPFLYGSILLGVALTAPWLVRQHRVFGDALIGFRYASQQLVTYLPDVAMPWWFYAAKLPALVSVPVAALAVAGAASSVRRRDSLGLTCAGVSVAILLWFSCYRFKELRQVTSIMPFVAVLAAIGLTRVVEERLRGRGWVVVLVLAFAVALTAGEVQRVVGRHPTPGYPSFLDAMAYVRMHSTTDDRVIGAPAPQIAWYADRIAEEFPPRERLADRLRDARWVVITNFERGQPSYVLDLFNDLRRADAGALQLFRDDDFWTAVIPAADVMAHTGRNGEG